MWGLSVQTCVLALVMVGEAVGVGEGVGVRDRGALMRVQWKCRAMCVWARASAAEVDRFRPSPDLLHGRGRAEGRKREERERE